MSKTTNIPNGAEKIEQASAVSTNAVARRRVDIQTIQNVSLVWLNPNMDDQAEDFQNAVIQLKRVLYYVNIFPDTDQCIQFINTTPSNKICIIVSATGGRQIVPVIHHLSQVDSIFILCPNRQQINSWTTTWPKIKGIFTELAPICEYLRQVVQQCEQNTIPISFITSKDIARSNDSLSCLDFAFVYSLILQEILSTIHFEKRHFNEFIAYFLGVFADNEEQMNNIKQLEQTYYTKTPIWWYTSHLLLSPMLNFAQRSMDMDTIIRMGFFIDDLHRHIKQLHLEQSTEYSAGDSFTVYRGQGLAKKDFEQMRKTKGGLISFNNFLSTSKVRNISLDFAQRSAVNLDLVGILFTMTIDPSKSTTPFASITDVSYFHSEDEVLFSMHTVFRICEISSIDENNRFYEVKLILINDDDKEFHTLTNRVREETFPDDDGWHRLGIVLLQMGQSDKAGSVYEALLDQTTDASERGRIYHQLGIAKYNQGEYQEAITFYKKALDVYQQTLPPNHPDFAASYSNIGNVYDEIGDYPNALSYYEKDLEISQKVLPHNHPELGASYNNIGMVYDHMGQYAKAIASHKAALRIRQQSLPSSYSDLASSYNNIGNVYRSMGNHSKALSSHEKALQYRQQVLPWNHPELGTSCNNIGMIYSMIGDYSQAYYFYEQAVDIGQHSLPSDHPTLQQWIKNLEEVEEKL